MYVRGSRFLSPVLTHLASFHQAARFKGRPTFMVQKRKHNVMTSEAASSSGMVDSAAFEQLRTEMTAFDEKRETVIKQTRDTLKLSKQAIYCMHRGDIEGARKKLADGMTHAEKLRPIVDAEYELRSGGSYSSAMEEWAEGMVFLTFLTENRIPRPDELPGITRDEYLGGVLDFTGELNRYVVARATQRDFEAVKRCRDLTEELFGLFLQFDFRNGSLRKKFDGLKYTLKKMETTLYEQSLTSALGFQRPAEEEPAAMEEGKDSQKQGIATWSDKGVDHKIELLAVNCHASSIVTPNCSAGLTIFDLARNAQPRYLRFWLPH
eukprot:TRINITY_DN35232_c0_g1_i1.p1 TRINITY_DN35232_c0_g1~~TRINITY_DN35232_c0_g1_i1.p1  ORF type:complete len:322 (-),score=32.62 TRINITY_DN35232_c0_g1_i1:195-1160(-)